MTLKKGAIPKPWTFGPIRELTRDDMDQLKIKRVVDVAKRFRDPHHRVARLIAAGLRPYEVAKKSGYSYGRIRTLTADPTFMELVASYRADVQEAFVESVDDYYELATSNMLKAERQLAEKLDEADEQGELLPTRDLIAISRDAADRFGYGKKQTNLNVNVDFAAKLESARQRSGRVIDAVANPPLAESPNPSRTTTSPPRTQSRDVTPPLIRRRA